MGLMTLGSPQILVLAELIPHESNQQKKKPTAQGTPRKNEMKRIAGPGCCQPSSSSSFRASDFWKIPEKTGITSIFLRLVP